MHRFARAERKRREVKKWQHLEGRAPGQALGASTPAPAAAAWRGGKEGREQKKRRKSPRLPPSPPHAAAKTQRHRGFPGGHPPQYWSGLDRLNFRVLMGSGVVRSV